MHNQPRSHCRSSVSVHRSLGALAGLLAIAGLQVACTGTASSTDALGGSASVSGGASSNGGSTAANGGTTAANGGSGTTSATGGTTVVTGGTTAASGGTTAANTGGSQAKGGTTGSPTGGTTSTSSNGGTVTTAGGTSSTSGGQSAIGGRGGAATSGGSNSTTGGTLSQGGGSVGSGGRASGGAAGKSGTGGTSGSGGTTGVGGSNNPTGGVAGMSSTGTSPSDYCPATEPCRISPLGDSITEGMGWNYPNGGGYRSKLFSLGLKDSKNFTFVGTRSNGPATVDGKPFPKNHEGTSGITIQDLQKNVVDKGALTGAAVKPHIILLHIGTNNLSGGTATGNINLLSSLIDSVIKNCPDALLVVAKIIPFNGSEKGYNDLIPALVDTKAKAGAHIMLVDQSAGFSSSDIADGVHPNEAGYTKMANVWYKAISQYLH